VALQPRDRYGRLLAAIWRDGQLVQEQLVREGLCVPYTLAPNVECVDRIRAAADQARREGARGLRSGAATPRIVARVPPAPDGYRPAVSRPVTATTSSRRSDTWS
jgi:endonuclease YncB( thermonuclease family)